MPLQGPAGLTGGSLAASAHPPSRTLSKRGVAAHVTLQHRTVAFAEFTLSISAPINIVYTVSLFRGLMQGNNLENSASVTASPLGPVGDGRLPRLGRAPPCRAADARDRQRHGDGWRRPPYRRAQRVVGRDGDQPSARKQGETITWRGGMPLAGVEPTIDSSKRLIGTALGRQSLQPTSGPRALGYQPSEGTANS